MVDKLKSVLSVLVLLGVFGLCGLGLYQDKISVEAAIATSLSALSSAGALAVLFAKKPEDEEK